MPYRLISPLHCEENILILEDTPHPQTLLIIRSSTIFLRPTLYDGDAISVREALALGTPVIASNTDFRPEGTLLFDIGNFEDLKDKISECLHLNYQKNNNFVKHIHEDKNLGKILDCYLEVLKQ